MSYSDTVHDILSAVLFRATKFTLVGGAVVNPIMLVLFYVQAPASCYIYTINSLTWLARLAVCISYIARCGQIMIQNEAINKSFFRTATINFQ